MSPITEVTQNCREGIYAFRNLLAKPNVMEKGFPTKHAYNLTLGLVFFVQLGYYICVPRIYREDFS